MVDGAMASAPTRGAIHGFSTSVTIIRRGKMAFIKLTDDELREQMQEVMDNVADQLKAEAVKTICSEGTSVPMSADITIHIGVDMIPTITYCKESYVYPAKAILSKRWQSEVQVQGSESV
jgi:hypothetical protein